MGKNTIAMISQGHDNLRGEEEGGGGRGPCARSAEAVLGGVVSAGGFSGPEPGPCVSAAVQPPSCMRVLFALLNWSREYPLETHDRAMARDGGRFSSREGAREVTIQRSRHKRHR